MEQVDLGQLGLPIVKFTGSSPMPFLVQAHNIFSPALQGPIGKDIKSRLETDERVQQLLGKHISQGQTAAIFEDTSLLGLWWLWRANTVGIKLANEDLERFLTAAQIPATVILWVHGLNCAGSVAVTKDVQLVNINDLPDSQQKGEYLRASFGHLGSHPPPAAALVKSYLVQKVSPGSGPEASFEAYGQPNLRVQEELSSIATILNCCPGICCVPGYSTTYVPQDVPFGPFAGSGGGTPLFDVLPRRITYFQSGQEALATSLLQKYQTKSQQAKNRLQRALFRLATAKSRLNDGDRALDLGIALEMLLLNNEHAGQELPGQLNLHFRLRGSWLIGNNATERRWVYRELGKIYGFRSQLAHNGFSDELDKMDYEKRQSILSQHISIAERIFQKLILDDPPAEWASLILGEK